ncbi:MULTISPECIES: ESPR-type extended signal peptide-containing protein [Stenotrophomonas]|uniref:ESPR-type extended signal peptide-containing protein n=1 Tax=Stenotrophomonas TaxID=40323 RepID=UPI00066DB3A7|nr:MULTISPECIES: ESPR-type extended signal peptide-containing protein [Stenotrophomonas]MBA0352339.1 hemagluttinin domain-containing protein [Stenotrophomonas maltophilia]MBH1695310.1 YadA-like family protein [Stenotrophomonas maltophilia]MBH1817527.1 YadA-like family protein [Stenotrophomonas maltophilia]MCU1032091.1 YadA-like family protein [Stenotrophomonas maltophilia]MDH0550821.1 ESPR-type extended signal peptide-containing protein [Stenotrophomonas sp. GD04006]
MNHIYRRIWSTAKQCWVVGSELARTTGKGTSGRRATVLMGCLISLPFAAGSAELDSDGEQLDLVETTQTLAFAEPAQEVPTVGMAPMSARAGQNAIELGYLAGASGNGGIAIGLRAKSNEAWSVAVGADSNAAATNSVAVGDSAKATARAAIALGKSARSLGEGDIAIGGSAQTVGVDAGISRIAIGAGAKAGTQGRTGAVALGGASTAEFDGVSIGYNSKASKAGAVALGVHSIADELNTVSVGNKTMKRRIVNLDDARLTSSSTDAVTGKQLYATEQKIGSLNGMLKAGSHTDAFVIGTGSVSASANTVSVGSASKKRRIQYLADGVIGAGSTDAMTGNQLHATNTKVAAVEKTANTAKTDLVAVREIAQKATQRIDAAAPALGRGALAETGTYGASTALGDAAKAYNSGSVALGANALAGVDVDGKKIVGSNSGVSLGVNSRSGNGGVAAGFRADSTGTWSVAMGTDAKAQADQSTAVGYLSKATASQSTALGRGSEATAQYASALGNLSKATTVSAVALGDRAQAKHENAVALGAGSVTYSANSVSVGNASVKRKIQYVADGSISKSSTDAVTGSQLFDAQQSVAKAQTAADSALAKAAALSGLLNESGASGNVRLGGTNSGTLLDVRNSANASRKITGVADAALSTTSTEAVTGRQLAATNTHVSTAQSDANKAKTAANTALTQVGTLNGLLSQASASGDVRVGGKNSGTVLDVRNSANANRKLAGVTDGEVGASSYEAVNGRQLNATNDKVATVEGIARSAGTEAAAAKTDAARALTETAALGGLVAQVSASGNVRLGEKNSGTTLDVRNSANANRKISGVADGLLSVSSAEAVSGKQLYSSNSRISVLEDASQFLSIGVAPTIERAEAGLAGVALGNSAKTGSDGGTAVGTLAKALGRNSVAIGRASVVHEDSDSGFALGAGAEVGIAGGGARGGVAIGAGAKVGKGANGSLAIGEGSQANEAGVASFGSATAFRRLVNVARGTADHNATTVSQLNDSLATLGGGAGMDGSGNIIAPTYTVQGGTQNTVEDALMALDGAVTTAGRRADKVEGQLSSIFQDSPSARADGTSQIALSGVNGMVLTNLADGRVAQGSRDAVTGSQLYAAEQKISQNRDDLDAMRKEREMGQQAMRGLDASVIDYGGARLTGVAEAKLSADSSDVVRGSQLYETNSRVSALEGISQYVSVGTAPEYGQAQAGPAGLAIGNLAKTGIEGGTAIGTFAEAMGRNSIALGRASTVYEGSDSSFAIGTGAEVGRAGEPGAIGAIAFGVGSRVEPGARDSIAFGTSSHATEAGVVSFGNVGTKRRLVNIANGTANHNAATVGQLRGALSALGGEVDANGNIVGPRFNVQGQTQSTLNGALEALDGAVVTNASRVDKVETQLRSVFQDAPSVRADGVNQLTLAGANGMVISNVANGLIAAGSRDAVNGGQLHSMQQQLNGRMDGLEQRIDDAPAPRALASSSVPKPQAEETPVVPEGKDSQQVASVGEGDKPTPQPKANKDDSPKPQVDTAELEKMLARANEYTDGAISNVERRLDKMDKRFNRMAAMSSAQTAMAMNTAGLATYNRLGAGVGYSEGESAMAVGYQRVLNEKGSATFSLNGAFTNSGERSMGVGVGIGW